MNNIHIDYKYDVSQESLNDPEKIKSVRVVLPSGLSAKFIRADNWTQTKSTKEQ